MSMTLSIFFFNFISPEWQTQHIQHPYHSSKSLLIQWVFFTNIHLSLAFYYDQRFKTLINSLGLTYFMNKFLESSTYYCKVQKFQLKSFEARMSSHHHAITLTSTITNVSMTAFEQESSSFSLLPANSFDSYRFYMAPRDLFILIP